MAGAGKLQCLVVIMAVLSTISCYYVFAADPDPLQDICVAHLTSDVRVNGFSCKPTFKPSDFFFAGLAEPALTNNPMGSNATPAFVMQMPGLNTQGVSMARVDHAPGGLNPPHTHPRATEIIFVLYGELEAFFITTNNVFVSKTMKQGEIFLFPRGLVHGQINTGKEPSAIIAMFNSQNPGVQTIATTLFNATPPVPDHLLAIAFQISIKEVEKIKSGLAQNQY